MPDELNPYSPPLVEGENLALPHPLRALLGPSIALLILSGASVLVGVSCVLLLWVPFESAADVIRSAVLIGAGVANLFVFYGALAMRKGIHYRAAIIAAIISMVPFLTSCIWIGIPFGIWALVVLRRPAVRAAFQS
jgi:hypothetical protein